MAEKQGFHVFPSPAQMIATIVALPLAVAKGLEAAPARRSGRKGALQQLGVEPVGFSIGCDREGVRTRVLCRDAHFHLGDAVDQV
jgi:hypothetical protein